MKGDREVVGIVTAAGLSRRCPEGKLFLPWGEGTVLTRTVSNLLASGPALVLVVTGHRGDEIRELLVDIPCPVVYNPRYREGMGTSVVAGLKAALKYSELSEQGGLLLLPADTPFIPVATLKEAIDSYRAGKGEIVVASHSMRRGHPVIFHRRFADSLIQACLKGDGARQVVRENEGEIFYVEGGAEVLEDIDTLEDYRRLKGRYGNT